MLCPHCQSDAASLQRCDFCGNLHCLSCDPQLFYTTDCLCLKCRELQRGLRQGERTETAALFAGMADLAPPLDEAHPCHRCRSLLVQLVNRAKDGQVTPGTSKETDAIWREARAHLENL